LKDLPLSKDDATAPARVIAKFAKTAPAIEIKAGIVEGKFYDAAGMAVISQIPSREELLSRLLGSMQSPITNFARCIKQIAEKDGEAAPAADAAPTEEAPAEA
jgi:LSU ribosomal protein L10P